MNNRSLGPRFWRLASINVLSNVTVPLVGLVDTVMLGHLPDIRFLAGVALATLLFDYVYWGFGFLRMGTTGVTAQAVGRSDEREVVLCLGRGLVLALITSAFVLLFAIPIADLGFQILSGEADVEQAGREYYFARIWGAPAVFANYVLIGWFLGREQAGRVLTLTVVGNVANILLNYLFIMKLGLAAEGAGFASMLSQYLSVAVGLALLFPATWWHKVALADVLDRPKLFELLKLNRDIFIRTLCLITAFSCFTNFSAILGTAVLAANAILLRVLTLASYLIDGAAYATEALAGNLDGSRDMLGLKKLLRLSLAVSVVSAGIFLLPLLLAPRPILTLLTSHQDVADLAQQYSFWLLPVLGLGCLAYIFDGFFIGLTRGRLLRLSMTLSLLLFLPVALFALERRDNHWLWASLAVLMVARVLTLGWAARPWLTRSGSA